MLFVPRFCSSAGRSSTSRAAADGLVDPLTVQVEQQIPPTDRQMDYALELEAMIPDGVCKDDVSAIISRITDEDEEAPDPGLSRYAHACGVKFSRFVGAKALLGYMVGQLQGAARAELYATRCIVRKRAAASAIRAGCLCTMPCGPAGALSLKIRL